MSTSTTILISCLVALLVLNFLLPDIMIEFDGSGTVAREVDEYLDDVENNLNASQLPQTASIFGVGRTIASFYTLILGVLIWNWQLNVYINMFLMIIRLAMYIAFLEIILP